MFLSVSFSELKCLGINDVMFGICFKIVYSAGRGDVNRSAGEARLLTGATGSWKSMTPTLFCAGCWNVP